MMGNYFGNIMGGFGFGFGWIFMLVFWGLIIWAVFVLVRRISGQDYYCGNDSGKHGRKENSALDILKERYAKGEISKGEFDRIKKDLE